MNRWNPQGELFDRPVPAGIFIDVSGLVESWVAIAEDWLTAYLGSSPLLADELVKEQSVSYREMTSREAFEGIECLARLIRCQDSLIEQATGMSVVEQLQQVLTEDNPSRIAEQALAFPDLAAWLQQAKATWEEDPDDDGATNHLIYDLDAADFLMWFVEQYARVLVLSWNYHKFENQLAICQQWLAKHTVTFIPSEPTIRAIAKTISTDLDSKDLSGCLSLSSMKYITLLDQCEAAWDHATSTPSLDFLLNQPLFGRRKFDFLIPELAGAAGASQTFIAPQLPMQWHDLSGKYEATIYLPSHRVPGEETRIEIMFGEGEGYADSAIDLIGLEVRLGAATGVVVSRQQGVGELVYASLNLAEIMTVETNEIELFVKGERWDR